MLLLNNSKRKKLLIGTAMTVFVSLVVFAGVLPNAFAATSFYLANAAVELDGTNNGEVTISLNTAEADSIFSVRGIFETTSGGGNFTLTELTPPSGITPNSNSVGDGTIYWFDSSWAAPLAVGARGSMWSATYTVDKDTPAGTTSVCINDLEVASLGTDYDTTPATRVCAEVTVTRNDTPATKPWQMVTFYDKDDNQIGEGGITVHYGDADFKVTKAVTTGDGNITSYAPNDGDSEHPGSIVMTKENDMIGVNGVGDMEVCATVEETANYAETTVCYWVHVEKRLLDIVGVTIEPKTYDGLSSATVTGVSFEDRDLANTDYTATAQFDNANAGTNKELNVSVTLVGDAANNYTLNADNYNTTGTISPFVLTSGNVELLGGSTFGYDPDGVEPEVRVTANVHGGTSTLGSNDYEVSYGSNTAKGTGHVYVTGKNNFTTGENPIDFTFTIEARGINGSNLVVPSTIMQGHILTVDELSVVVDGHTLVQCANNEDTDCDYYIAISGDNDGIVGHTVNVSVNAREGGNYSGIANAENIPIVAKQTQTVTFGGDVTNTTVNKTYGDANFTYTASSNGDGTISYGSSNESVVTVNNNGEVTIVGVGDALITAVATETDTYASGSASYTVRVGKKTISFTSATVPFKKYDGTVNATVSEASLSESSLVFGTDFTVTNAAYPSAGASTYANTVYVEVSLNASVTDRYQFSDSGATTASINVSSAITPFALSADNTTVTIDSTPLYYTGEAQTPGVTAKVDLDGDGTKETDLTNADYTLSYYENVNAGTATVLINGKGNYAASPDGSHFTINKVVVTNLSATAESQTFTGSALEPAVTVTGTVNGSNVTFTTNDYTVAEHAEFVNAGDHTFTINGKVGSNYDIPATNGTFTIEKADSGEPAEFSEEFRIEAGKTLADLGERSAGFSWADATTPVAVGSNNYSATYIRDNDATNYNPSHLSLPVYGLKKVNVAVTDSAVGGTSSSNSAMVLEGDDAVITFTPDDKFELASVTVNGTDRTADVSNNKLTITAGADDIAVVASYRRVYEVVEGDGQTHVKNVDGSADFEIDAPYAYFNGKVFVDGVAVSADNYEAWGKNPLAEKGSGEELLSLMASDDLTHTMVRLTEAYLNTLSVGEHTLAVQFSDDGIARAVFYIKDPETKTADTGVFTGERTGATVAGVSVFATVVLAGVAFVLKKRNN